MASAVLFVAVSYPIIYRSVVSPNLPSQGLCNEFERMSSAHLYNDFRNISEMPSIRQ